MQITDPIIPRHIVWADPERFLVKLSPDAKYISYLAPFEDNLNLWVAPLGGSQMATPVTISQHPLKEYWWATDSSYLLYIHDHYGDENWQLHGFSLTTGKTITYTKPGTQVRVLHFSASKPNKILIGLNERDKRFHDPYLLDIQTGQLECLFENREYWDFFADDDLNLRLGIKVNGKGGEYIDIASPSKTCLSQVSLHDLFGLYYYPRLRLGLATNNKLYLTQSINNNTSMLISVDMSNQSVETLGKNNDADVCDVLLNPQNKVPLAFAVNYERKKWQSLDDATGVDFTYLQSIDDGDIDILSQSTDNEHWLVGFYRDNGPTAYYHYDRQQHQAHYLFDSHSDFKHYPFTKMHPRVITMRDGLSCVCYLSLPRQSDINEKGIPSQPLPLVLMVHGGPNYRDIWCFNPTHQWLANRGYAVLSVNYRASTGFGKAHLAAGHGEWGGKIQLDLLDAVEWAISQGITTRDKVAIMGRSFGGYATLVGLSMTPDVFCCGVDIVGPSNLETMAKHFPPYWRAMQGAIQEMLGCDPDTPEGNAYLKERSPLFYAKQIKKPLLIGHGANDVRVMQSESDQMVASLKENHIPVTYAIFPDEGHQFLHPGNRMAFYALAEAFLAKILKGQVEPYDEHVHTSMIVKEDDFKLHV
ncbi:MAG: hypothetical protein BGO43_08230 [Gammaproteobacteria bacterium 39-13]|nr:S9 family peptidase [Gammaproteobacteria bacterium]OJV91658.1 MAG: hypothetical protein BGO43_08230 [Gammaproteobacteria bacterium 39-13]